MSEKYLRARLIKLGLQAFKAESSGLEPNEMEDLETVTSLCDLEFTKPKLVQVDST